MPILDIEIVSDRTERIRGAMTQALADELGGIFGAEAGRVWVKVRTLPQEQYAENGGSAAMPVFVAVTVSALPEGDALHARVSLLTDAVARITRRPRENVHVEFQPAARGRIAFGGRLVE
jgi:phenylpyruvate tautomerase PptA (4-oxalocrotonate tautomerase family)